MKIKINIFQFFLCRNHHNSKILRDNLPYYIQKKPSIYVVILSLDDFRKGLKNQLSNGKNPKHYNTGNCSIRDQVLYSEVRVKKNFCCKLEYQVLYLEYQVSLEFIVQISCFKQRHRLDSGETTTSKVYLVSESVDS